MKKVVILNGAQRSEESLRLFTSQILRFAQDDNSSNTFKFIIMCIISWNLVQ